MKIAILGAGALGSLFGSSLTRSGNEVYLIDPVEPLVAQIKKEGITATLTTGEVIHTMVNIESSAAEVAKKTGPVDLIMVFTKGMHTEDAVVAAKPLVGDNTCFLSLQNGIGNPQIIAKHYPEEKIFYGVTMVGAAKDGFVKVVEHSAPGATSSIMSLSGKVTPELEKVAETITNCGMKTIVNEKADQMIWEKLAMNCVANSANVISRLTNGNFIRDPNGQEVARMIVREVCEVANAKGIPLDYEKIMPWIIEKLSPQTEMYSSMAQDAKNRRPIEIETITGGVVREAEKLGIPVPVNKVIYHFDKLIAANYDKQF